MGSEQVAAVLRQSGSHVRLVVARPVEPTSPDYQALGSHAPIVPTKILGDAEELDRHLLQNGYGKATISGAPLPSGADLEYDPSMYIYGQQDGEIELHVSTDAEQIRTGTFVAICHILSPGTRGSCIL